MIPTLTSIDPSASRANAMTMPDQVFMELLIETCVPDYQRKDFTRRAMRHTGPTPACSWEDVHCDEEDNVTRISWSERTWLRGSVSLDMLPKKLETLSFAKSALSTRQMRFSASLHGTVKTASLPGEMRLFDIQGNVFHGEIDLTALPATMEIFNALRNQFEGTLDLTALPAGLKRLNLGANKCTGTICLRSLPAAMQSLILNGNRLTGTLSLDALPDGLQALYLQQNSFSGDLSFRNMPKGWFRMLFTRSNFSSIEGEVPKGVVFQ